MPLINENPPEVIRSTTATRSLVNNGADRLREEFFKHALT